MKRLTRHPSAWVFLVLLASYAYFWHARDWNTASRLMLTYALVDRGTVRLDGLDDQTGDIARFQGHFYTDKLPGYSFLGAPPYALARAAGMPPHPLDREGFPFWPADYVVTLCVSGCATALLGAWLTAFALAEGLGPRRSALIGLAFGLATPAYPYATLAYGHNVTALALFGSFALIARGKPQRVRSFVAGLLAALAVVIEVQSAPVALVLAVYLLARTTTKARRGVDLAAFALGAIGPTLLLAGYNLAAFGSPWDMGYFHHATPRFAQVHSRANPLGLVAPDWSKVSELLFGRYRGLLFHAPILWLALPGWVVMAARRSWGPAMVTLAACLSVSLVNLSYPEWTGGWSTGPRLLVPLLPFAMVPVAALLTRGGRGATALAIALTLAGGVVMLMYQGVGARIPDLLGTARLEDPFLSVVWPLWRGDPVPPWWLGERFTRNAFAIAWPGWDQGRPASWRWPQFAPLVLLQLLLAGAMCVAVRERPGDPAQPTARPADYRGA